MASLVGKRLGLKVVDQIRVRDQSYTPPAKPAKRCETCTHFFCGPWRQEGATGTCEAFIDSRHHSATRLWVHPLGVCNLWEEKE